MAFEYSPRCGVWARMRNVVSLVLLACSSSCMQLHAQVAVDGASFAALDCRNLAVQGFAGIELIERNGRRLRLVKEPDGHAAAYVFDPRATVASKACHAVTVTSTCQPVAMDGICAVHGHAELACTDLAGHVEFSGCL
jgi:hypothetical protein